MNFKEYISKSLKALRARGRNSNESGEGSGYRTEYRWWMRFSGLPETIRQFKRDELRIRKIAEKYGIDPNKSLGKICNEFIEKCKKSSSQYEETVIT